MRLPLDAQQPVTKPVAPKPFPFKHLPFWAEFIIRKHTGAQTTVAKVCVLSGHSEEAAFTVTSPHLLQREC